MTSGGLFGLAFQYDIQLLSHFRGKTMNLPFYLKISLSKMATVARKNIVNIDHNLHHHMLICIIMQEVLSRRGDNWESFLRRNQFVSRVEDVLEVSKGQSMATEREEVHESDEEDQQRRRKRAKYSKKQIRGMESSEDKNSEGSDECQQDKLNEGDETQVELGPTEEEEIHVSKEKVNP